MPGSTKTRFAQNFKHETDVAIEKTLDQEIQVIDKRRTKGLFNVETATNAGKWMIDRNWKQKANTLYKSCLLYTSPSPRDRG